METWPTAKGTSMFDHESNPNFIIIVIIAVALLCAGCGKRMELPTDPGGADTTQVAK